MNPSLPSLRPSPQSPLPRDKARPELPLSPRERGPGGEARRLLAFVLLLLILVPLSAGDLAARIKDSDLPPDLPQKYRTWLLDVELLLKKKEIKAFLALEKNHQRDAFIERFWAARDPFPETERNEFQEAWYARLEHAREEFDNSHEDRARVLLLNGEPTSAIAVSCPLVLWPVEIWHYEGSDQVRFSFDLLFYQPNGTGRETLWYPEDGIIEPPPNFFFDGCPDLRDIAGKLGVRTADAMERGEMAIECLAEQMQNRCRGAAEVVIPVLRNLFVHQSGFTLRQLISRLESTPNPREGEWLASFAAHSTDIPEDAVLLPGEVSFAYPGKDGFRTLVQAVVEVPAAEAATVELAGRTSYNFQVTGEVLRSGGPDDGTLFESFRYKFDLPLDQLEGDTLRMVFQRPLRPARYTLLLKVEDLASGKLMRAEREITVPAVDDTGPPPPDDPRTAALFEEANRALDPERTRLRLVAPPDEVQTGMVRFDTLAVETESEPFDRVTFYLNGKAVLSKKRPPYSVELDLGTVPRVHRVRVLATDRDGEVLASDEIEVNTGQQRFAVRLLEPRRGQRYRGSLLARAALDTPDGSSLERLEIYLGEELVATLYQEPWSQPVQLPASTGPGPDGQPQLTYLRAVAYLEDGNSTEDVVFINAPESLEEVDIQLVELYTTVVDGQGRPVEGLTAEDFEVEEDGTPQELVRFDLVTDLPIHAGILFDTSASMEDRLDRAREAALGFFQQIITPKDRAAVVTFNDRPHLAVELTNDIQGLAVEMAGLKAERSTALWDSLIFTLYYFNGLKGQRAILILSDGRDEASRHTYKEALGYAQTAGVALYTIGLDLPAVDVDSRRKLAKLAEVTGGASFFIDRPEELPAIYEQIQRELRSKYLLAYQSSNTTGSTDYRSVKVKARDGGEVKTLTGYYP